MTGWSSSESSFSEPHDDSSRDEKKDKNWSDDSDGHVNDLFCGQSDIIQITGGMFDSLLNSLSSIQYSSLCLFPSFPDRPSLPGESVGTSSSLPFHLFQCYFIHSFPSHPCNGFYYLLVLFNSLLMDRCFVPLLLLSLLLCEGRLEMRGSEERNILN